MVTFAAGMDWPSTTLAAATAWPFVVACVVLALAPPVKRARCRERGRIGGVLYLGLGHHHHAQVDRQGHEAEQGHQGDGHVGQNRAAATARSGLYSHRFLLVLCQLASLDITAVP